ncbi:unnamed protein product [marine sediment metagenome]|uniref:Uncharacterized protein n=1 Tax=marine sediment metagenome TaxID=412755 RepID=X1ENG5_9ZZZZ
MDIKWTFQWGIKKRGLTVNSVALLKLSDFIKLGDVSPRL